MNPIILNKEGEELMTQDEIPEESKLTAFSAGRHSVCNGTMRVIGVSRTHKALVCPECCLRILFPQDVGTFRELRAYLLETDAS